MLFKVCKNNMLEANLQIPQDIPSGIEELGRAKKKLGLS